MTGVERGGEEWHQQEAGRPVMDGWHTPRPGQSMDDFIAAFVAARPPLTGGEITRLRAVFRTATVAPPADEDAVSQAA
ncbi:hypothetical protein GTY86_02920 [Streptomyces sp. SID5770]|uniref:hypothetical protein n=1 Tax=Streptomyces sp. SID5770 TaxID=2690308 RepID=UPI001370E4AB|nr:hypothetical protein [Streptomyces sp. SID5770]MZE50287.1 hypothetical protein [Streptomyces sp. SID5770]